MTGYASYLKLEKGLSPLSVSAYRRDVKQLADFFPDTSPLRITLHDLRAFINEYASGKRSPRSQARLISSIRSFYGYLLLEKLISTNPAELLETPRVTPRLPDTLSVEEIDAIIGVVDLSSRQGERNRAILETLYGCGLRVSELIGLRLNDLYPKQGYIKVIGKGNKQRLVPLADSTYRYIRIYVEEVRVHQSPGKGHEGIVFLNNRGTRLSRVMIFKLVKKMAEAAGIRKNVSPHTFRHSFATHMVEGGADLRSVQAMLGHESITTTEIYTHLDHSYLSSALRHHPRA